MAQTGFVFVALGDSTGVGVGARQGGGYPDRLMQRLLGDGQAGRIFNACVSGAQVADVFQRQVDYAMAANPTLVTVGIGINDLWRGTPPASYRADLTRIAERIAKTSARVVATNIPDLAYAPVAQSVPKSMYEGRIETFNVEIAAVAAHFGWAVVDLFHASQQYLPDHPEYFSEDGFHPSDAGYERWTDVMWPVVRAMTREQSYARTSGL